MLALQYLNKEKTAKEIVADNDITEKFLCEVWKVNRRNYYKRTPTTREKENEIIKEKIQEIHKSVNGIYGFRRMTMNVNRQLNKKYNYKRIYRLMKEELKISSVIRRKKKKYIKSSAEYKAEKYYLKRYETLKDLEEAIEEYIKFYNEERLQKNLGNRSPLEYRKYQGKNVDN